MRGSESRIWAEPWQRLAASALEPAGYNSPELMLPLLEARPNVELAIVDLGPDALFVAPFVRQRLFDASFESPLTAAGTPHISGVQVQEATLAYLKSRKRPFLFKAIPSEGKVFAALKAQSTHFQVLKSWQRAALAVSGNFEDWFQNNFDQKRRKEFKRLRNRLGEQGALKLETLSVANDVESFSQDLLELEAGGWKGKRGTSLKSDAKLADAFCKAMHDLFAAGKLRYWRLTFNGKTIASLFAIVEGQQAWLGKIAYDESFAKYSPGVLIILDATEHFFNEPGIALVDSSAIPDHPMIDRIWRDRIAMSDVLVAADSVSALKFEAAFAALRVHSTLRGRVKSIFYRITKWKKS